MPFNPKMQAHKMYLSTAYCCCSFLTLLLAKDFQKLLLLVHRWAQGGGEGGSPWLEPSFLHPSLGQKLHPTPSEAKITPPIEIYNFKRSFLTASFSCLQLR